MVTGSHNPPDYNGLKMVLGDETLSGDAIQKLRARLLNNDLAHGAGGYRQHDIAGEYLTRIVSDVKLTRPMKIIVDCGNGVPGAFAPKLYRDMGCQVEELFCEVDGNFPNHPPDPTVESNLVDLKKAVADGQRVRVWNDLGEIQLPLRITDAVPRGVVSTLKGAWLRTSDNGQTVSALCPAHHADICEGACFNDARVEVGPLARAVIARAAGGNPVHVALLDRSLSHLRLRPENLVSVLGRHLARAIKTKIVADAMADWVLQIKLDQPVATPFTLPEEARGCGLWDASRGALGHWISIKDRKIERYQAVVPTTWNASPRDDQGRPGALEAALVGAPVADAENPFSVARIVRSFDPCMVCTVH